MNYAQIKKFDIADGPGVRVALFVSGCTHRCQGCFNSEAWDFAYGNPFDETVQEDIIATLDKSYIKGLTLLGGEPFEPANQRALLPFIKKVRQRLPQKDIWCYSGYLLDEELMKDSRARCEVTDEMLSLIDVLVDGKFVEKQKNISLLFRGSENQRIIDLKKTLEKGEIVLWEGLENEVKHKKITT